MPCPYKSLLQMQTKNSVQKKRADLKVGPYEIFLF